MNTRTRLLIFALLVAAALPAQAQTPAAEIKDSGGTTLWQLNTDAGLKVLGSLFTGSIPAEGRGTRLMWYPGKAAFRAGQVNGTQWDDVNVGFISTAMGVGTTASGDASTAMGNGTTASGFSSTAMGSGTTASGNHSTAMGLRASTDGFEGSFVYGDFSTLSTVTNTAENQFMVRAAGGTTFFSNSALTSGVMLAANGASWASVSDSTRKTHFRAADGETVLAGLRRLRLGSWNYRGQDPARHRHYGPMAQEFFAAYGHDGVGVIGTDTTIATADADGVLFIAAQALERRTREQQARIEALEAELAAVRDRAAATEARLATLEAALGRRASEPAALPASPAPDANR